MPELLLGISPTRGLHSKYYSRITSACLARSQARGLHTNNYSTWLIRLSYLVGYTLQVYSNDGFREHWGPLDWLPNHFKAKGYYATPIIQFFQDGRFGIKIDPQLESTAQPKAQGLLYMECNFATALPYSLDFKTDELDHLPTLWQFRYYWRLFQAVLEDA
jgi:hypothetical protein